MATRDKIFLDTDVVFAAKAEGGISVIITRNRADYAASEVPVLSPDEFLGQFDLRND